MNQSYLYKIIHDNGGNYKLMLFFNRKKTPTMTYNEAIGHVVEELDKAFLVLDVFYDPQLKMNEITSALLPITVNHMEKTRRMLKILQEG